jgi:hypothetical protein
MLVGPAQRVLRGRVPGIGSLLKVGYFIRREFGRDTSSNHWRRRLFGIGCKIGRRNNKN